MDQVFQTYTSRRAVLMRVGEMIKAQAPEVFLHQNLTAGDAALAAEGVRSLANLGGGLSQGNTKEFYSLVQKHLDKVLPGKLDEARLDLLCSHYSGGHTYGKSYWFEKRVDPKAIAYAAFVRNRKAAIEAEQRRSRAEARTDVQTITFLLHLSMIGQSVARHLPPRAVRLRDLEMPF